MRKEFLVVGSTVWLDEIRPDQEPYGTYSDKAAARADAWEAADDARLAGHDAHVFIQDESG